MCGLGFEPIAYSYAADRWLIGDHNPATGLKGKTDHIPVLTTPRAAATGIPRRDYSTSENLGSAWFDYSPD